MGVIETDDPHIGCSSNINGKKSMILALLLLSHLNTMTGCKTGQGRSGRGRGDGRGGGGGHGHAYNSNKSMPTKVGLCKEIKGNIFDYGSKTSADLMRTTQEKIVQYAASKYGGDIANELQNRTPVIINAPEYSPHICARHAAWVTMVHPQQNNMLMAHQKKKTTIKLNIAANLMDGNLPMELAKVNNDIL